MKYLGTSLPLHAILTLGLFCAFLVGCDSTCDEVIEMEIAPIFDPPTTADFESLQQDAFQLLLQTVTLNVDGNGLFFTTPAGANIFIPSACLTLNGTIVTGDVDFEYLEIYERGDMLTTNSTTVGMLPGGGSELLVSGGMFFFNVTQNGEQVTLACEGSLTVPTALTGGDDLDMRPFAGTVNADGDIVWVDTQGELFIDGGNYTTFFPDFGWFNCDRFFNAPDPKTAITVAIPQEFTQENSNVYLALQGEPNSLAYLYGEFPVGLAAHIIFLSEEDGNFRYAVRTLTLEANQQVIFTIQETTVATLEEITNAINTLP